MCVGGGFQHTIEKIGWQRKGFQVWRGREAQGHTVPLVTLTPRTRAWNALALLLLAYGLWVRVAQYVYPNALWFDEARNALETEARLFRFVSS